jgi:hypothetical protein
MIRFLLSNTEVGREAVEPSNIVDAIIAIGTQRRQILVRMKEAVRTKDLETVLVCAEQLVGLNEGERAKVDNEEKSH